MEFNATPMYKYYESRTKVLSRQTKTQEKYIAPANDSDSDDEKLDQSKKSQKKQANAILDGDEDLVEDFELSDEEDDE